MFLRHTGITLSAFRRQRYSREIFLLVQRVKAGLLAAVEAHRLHVDDQNGDEVRAVLGVEVIQIRNVLEVVGVNLAALHDVVRLDVVGELLDVEGDVLRGQDLLGDGEDLGVRGGRCGDGDGRAGEGVVVDGVVIAIARVLPRR